jgi:putative transposase
VQKLPLLRPGGVYHIYNRGNNRENLFVRERNYHYFLRLYRKYAGPVLRTYTFCLLPNHFHLLVRVQPHPGKPDAPKDPTRQLSNLFNAYAKAMNKAYGRTGSLFQKRFGRIEVGDRHYFRVLVRYIHRNPEMHGLVADFREYPYSSYAEFLSDLPSLVDRQPVLDAFGGLHRFVAAHESPLAPSDTCALVDDEFEDEVQSDLDLPPASGRPNPSAA